MLEQQKIPFAREINCDPRPREVRGQPPKRTPRGEKVQFGSEEEQGVNSEPQEPGLWFTPHLRNEQNQCSRVPANPEGTEQINLFFCFRFEQINGTKLSQLHGRKQFSLFVWTQKNPLFFSLFRHEAQVIFILKMFYFI